MLVTWNNGYVSERDNLQCDLHGSFGICYGCIHLQSFDGSHSPCRTLDISQQIPPRSFCLVCDQEIENQDWYCHQRCPIGWFDLMACISMEVEWFVSDVWLVWWVWITCKHHLTWKVMRGTEMNSLDYRWMSVVSQPSGGLWGCLVQTF